MGALGSLFGKKKSSILETTESKNKLTREQIKWISDINNRIKHKGNVNISLKDTKSITSDMLLQIEDLNKLSIRMDLALSDFYGNYMSKYNESKYIDRVTYTGNEAYYILKKLEEFESKVDMSAPITMRAKQICDIISSEIPVMYNRTSPAHWLVCQSLRGMVSNNIAGEARLVCAGYSSVFREMCARCNIRCDYIRGVSVDPVTGEKVGHAWNIIIDENNRVIPIDVTWMTSGKTDK